VAPGPTFGSSPSRFWDVVVDGERVKFELYLIEGNGQSPAVDPVFRVTQELGLRGVGPTVSPISCQS
jgi:hypothetical protein